MARKLKYAPLTQWLQEQGKDTVHLSFAELTDIIPIPPSAYNDRPAWANCTTPSASSFQRSWHDAGFKVSAIRLTQQWVEFSRNGAAAPSGLQRETAPVAVTNRVDRMQLCNALRSGYFFYDSIGDDVNHRYLSWEHCHTVFKENRHQPSDTTVDYLCLHLAWYLASWGMLRNSFLMQKDYKIHAEVVKLICQPQWDALWDLPAEMMAQEQYAKQVMQLSQLITNTYIRVAGGTPTDTLLTKILLGTVGCVPAYDRYFKHALAITGAAPQKYGVRSIMALGRAHV